MTFRMSRCFFYHRKLHALFLNLEILNCNESNQSLEKYENFYCPLFLHNKKWQNRAKFDQIEFAELVKKERKNGETAVERMHFVQINLFDWVIRETQKYTYCFEG